MADKIAESVKEIGRIQNRMYQEFSKRILTEGLGFEQGDLAIACAYSDNPLVRQAGLGELLADKKAKRKN